MVVDCVQENDLKMSTKLKELPALGDMFVQLSGKQTTHLATLNILKEVIVKKAMSKCSFVAQEIFGTRMSEVLVYFQYLFGAHFVFTNCGYYYWEGDHDNITLDGGFTYYGLFPNWWTKSGA